MKYNINLLTGLPRKFTAKLPLQLVIRILAGYLGLLLIIWGWTLGVAIYQNSMLTIVTHSVDFAAKQWADLESKHIVTEGMNARVRLWSELLEKKSESGSIYLRDLALQVPVGVWLENIEIGNGGASIKLSGKTFNSPLAMTLLQNLNNAPAFKGKRFKVFNLTVAAPTQGGSTPGQKLASFTLSTE